MKASAALTTLLLSLALPSGSVAMPGWAIEQFGRICVAQGGDPAGHAIAARANGFPGDLSKLPGNGDELIQIAQALGFGDAPVSVQVFSSSKWAGSSKAAISVFSLSGKDALNRNQALTRCEIVVGGADNTIRPCTEIVGALAFQLPESAKPIGGAGDGVGQGWRWGDLGELGEGFELRCLFDEADSVNGEGGIARLVLTHLTRQSG